MSPWAGRGIASLRASSQWFGTRMSSLGLAMRISSLWLGAAFALSACELIDPPPQPPPEKPAAATQPAPATTPAAPAPSPRLPPGPPPPRPQFDIQSLIGMGEQDVAAVLGQPRQVRNDPPAMVWDYQANGCALSLFFYLDLKSQDFRTLAYNFDSGGATDSAKQLCVNRIQDINRDRRR